MQLKEEIGCGYAIMASMKEVIDKELEQRVTSVSKKLGLTKREVINRAVSGYIAQFNSLESLYKELRMWDVLSAETMRKNNF